MGKERVLGIIGAIGLGLSIIAGMPESGAASSKGGVNLPPPVNPRATSTPEVPEIKATPTPRAYKPSP